MSVIKTIPEILQVAKISQYLAGNDTANNLFLKGGSLTNGLATKIYMERSGVQNLYDLDPTNSALRPTANYVYALCGRYAIQAENIIANLDQAPPVVTGADDESVEDGQQVTFSIGVTSALPYVIQWYDQNGIIPGATSLSYSFTAALADDGNEYYAVVSNAAGSVQSATGELTVTQTIQGSYYYGSVDYYPELSIGIDNVPYQGTFNITDGNPLVVPFPLAASNNKFNIVKYPITQSDKTLWNNTQSNFGQIPDAQYRAIFTIGSWKYIVSRTEMSLDSTQTTVTYT